MPAARSASAVSSGNSGGTAASLDAELAARPHADLEQRLVPLRAAGQQLTQAEVAEHVELLRSGRAAAIVSASSGEVAANAVPSRSP